MAGARGYGSVESRRILLGDERAYRQWRARVAEVAGIHDTARFNIAPLAFADARVAIHTGDHSDAPALVARASAEFPGARYQTYAHAVAAELAVVAGLPQATDLLAAAAAAAAENDWAAACVARSRGRLHQDAAALTEAVHGWERIGARLERACTLLLPPDRTPEGRAELAALDVDTPAGLG